MVVEVMDCREGVLLFLLFRIRRDEATEGVDIVIGMRAWGKKEMK